MSEHESAAEPQAGQGFLRGPDLITAKEANKILAARPGQVVVWAGQAESGKTTLSCAIYERMRSAAARLKFGGSTTLLALEQRTFLSRAASGRASPHTLRTDRDPEGRELIHIAATADGRTSELLIADLPGETFRRIRDGLESAESAHLIGRADKIAFLADGARLVDPKRRAVVISNHRQLVARMLSVDIQRGPCDIALITTKWDLVAEDPEAIKYWETAEAALMEELREIDPTAQSFRISAAADRDPAIPSGMDRVEDWLVNTGDYQVEVQPPKDIQVPGPARVLLPRRLDRR